MTDALKKSGIVPVIFSLILFPACRDEVICTQDMISRVVAGFYVRDLAGERDTVLNDCSFYGLLRPDSLLYDGSSGIHKITFPLSQHAVEYTGFILKTDSLADTLRIYHSSRQELISFSCGFATVHIIERLGYGNSLIDTISISNTLVDLTDDENLKIYIRPAVAGPVD